MSLPLVLDPKVLREIARVQTFAEKEENWVTSENPRVPGDYPDYSLEIPVGYRAVYSVEKAGERPVRHLSVSSTTQQPPSRGTMSMLAQVFGFTNPTMGTMEYDPPWVIHAIEYL